MDVAVSSVVWAWTVRVWMDESLLSAVRQEGVAFLLLVAGAVENGIKDSLSIQPLTPFPRWPLTSAVTKNSPTRRIDERVPDSVVCILYSV